jgi:hypothetical protein
MKSSSLKLRSFANVAEANRDGAASRRAFSAPDPTSPATSGAAAASAPAVPPQQPPQNAHEGAPAANGWVPHLATLLFATAAITAIVIGLVVDTSRYLTAESGLGYTLGIVGGSLMLVMLLYSVRKRIPGLRRVGATTSWFKAHMVMGVVGPLLILYHSNFSLGATNSNVALFCMLAVAGSGVVGRYLYSRIHFGLYGRQATLSELQADANRLRTQVAKLQLVPNLIAQLEAAELKVLSTRTPILLRPAVVAFRAWQWRRRLGHYLHRQLRLVAPRSKALRDHGERFEQVVNRYIRERLEATRRVAEFQNYERLFAWWHVLHLPLFIMMILTGVAHVIAVHIY